MGDVVNFTGITSLDIPADRVLQAAIDEGLESVIVVGYTKDGNEFFASSIAGGPDCLWLMARFQKRLLEAVDGEG